MSSHYFANYNVGLKQSELFWKSCKVLQENVTRFYVTSLLVFDFYVAKAFIVIWCLE